MHLVKPRKITTRLLHARQAEIDMRCPGPGRGRLQGVLTEQFEATYTFAPTIQSKSNDHDLNNFERRWACLFGSSSIVQQEMGHISDHTVLKFKQLFVLSVIFAPLLFKTIEGVSLHIMKK